MRFGAFNLYFPRRLPQKSRQRRFAGDGVIHVAGMLRDRMIFNMTEEEWDDVIAVHLTGFFNVSKPASVLMRQQRFGRIVGFSSGSGLRGNTGQGNPEVTKANLEACGVRLRPLFGG